MLWSIWSETGTREMLPVHALIFTVTKNIDWISCYMWIDASSTLQNVPPEQALAPGNAAWSLCLDYQGHIFIDRME